MKIESISPDITYSQFWLKWSVVEQSASKTKNRRFKKAQIDSAHSVGLYRKSKYAYFSLIQIRLGAHVQKFSASGFQIELSTHVKAEAKRR